MVGELSDDAFLASLYERDNSIELGKYSTEYSSLEEAQKCADIIRDMPFKQLCKRVIEHSKLIKDFRHFQIIHFETYEESENPNMQKIPFLLSKRAMLNRYYEGKLLINIRKMISNYILNKRFFDILFEFIHLARNCLKNESGGLLMPKLSKQARIALTGTSLNLTNLYAESDKLPEQDKHLLVPPDSIQNTELYDLLYLIQYGRPNGQEIFSKLIQSYFELDRNLRVSHSIHLSLKLSDQQKSCSHYFSVSS